MLLTYNIHPQLIIMFTLFTFYFDKIIFRLTDIIDALNYARLLPHNPLGSLQTIDLKTWALHVTHKPYMTWSEDLSRDIMLL